MDKVQDEFEHFLEPEKEKETVIDAKGREVSAVTYIRPYRTGFRIPEHAYRAMHVTRPGMTFRQKPKAQKGAFGKNKLERKRKLEQMLYDGQS